MTTTTTAPGGAGVPLAVERAISSHIVTIFSKSYCPYCKSAKSAMASLRAPDVHVVELDASPDGPEIQAYLEQRTGQRTVPNVFIRSKHVGGNNDVQALRQSGELQRLVL